MAVATGIGIATPKYGEKKTNVAKIIQMMRIPVVIRSDIFASFTPMSFKSCRNHIEWELMQLYPAEITCDGISGNTRGCLFVTGCQLYDCFIANIIGEVCRQPESPK
jgi:hypothetical protein